MTLVPWSSGKCAVWDVTVIDTMANSYLNSTSTTAGGAADIAAASKAEKYQELARGYEVIPVAIETMGPMNPAGADFINGIGRLATALTGDRRGPLFFGRGFQSCCRGSTPFASVALLFLMISSSRAAIQHVLLIESFLSNP